MLIWLPVVTASDIGHSTEPVANEMCPVMPGNPVETQWHTVYKGHEVLFCCNNCVDAFRKSPERYVDRLPQFAKVRGAAAARNPWTWSQVRGIVVILVTALLFFFWRRLVNRCGHPAFSIRPVYGELICFVLVGLLIQFALTNRELDGEIVKSEALRVVHHATYYDHGYPPVPPKPELPPRLEATYYRGNDERSEFLFNGGNYLTAEMHISIRRGNGQLLEVGHAVQGETLFLDLTITKPPFAPQRLFGAGIMDRIYLTKEYGPLMGWDRPVPDRVQLTKDPSGDLWSASFRILDLSQHGPAIDPETATVAELLRVPHVDRQQAEWFLAYRDAGFPLRNADDLRQAGIDREARTCLASAFREAIHTGVVYVCEANYVAAGRQMGARFHYGMGYELVIRDGIVQADSNVWMGALSRSQKAAKGAIPEHEWLSSEPLPRLPHALNVSDELSGLDDYPQL